MTITISIDYSELFEGPKPVLQTLLQGIPSETCINILSMMNAKLQKDDSYSTQLEILKYLIQNQDENTRQSILQKALHKVEKNPVDPVHFFSPLYNLEFMHLELLNYRTFIIDDTTPENELNFLKAYFLIVENINEKYHEKFVENEQVDTDYFYKATWPTLIDQFEINHRTESLSAMVKGYIFLNYFEHVEKFQSYAKTFFNQAGVNTPWEYVYNIINILLSQHIWQKENRSDVIYSLKITDNLKGLFSTFEMNIQQYKTTYLNDKKNFNGIKMQPLFKYNDDFYLVLNWDFFYNKLYDGLIFDFYEKSGIDKEIKKFTTFKKIISEEVLEKYTFKIVLSEILRRKGSVLLFDERVDDGFPDCYFRSGNKVFLIEFKDAYFPSSAINSCSFETIKNAIDEKYNSPRKGTSQILKQLEFLSEKSFEHPKGYKNSNKLHVYPIIVYTDVFFGCPGFNKYLNDEFKQKLNDKGLDGRFCKIHNLSFINFNFLIKNIGVFAKPTVKFISFLESYQEFLKNKNKELKSQFNESKYFSIHYSFETVMQKKHRELFSKEYPLRYLFKLFKII